MALMLIKDMTQEDLEIWVEDFIDQVNDAIDIERPGGAKDETYQDPSPATEQAIEALSVRLRSFVGLD